MAGQSKLKASNSALPTKTSLPESTRILPHIPPEVSRLLSSHLDLSSAARLMRTCRGLQDAGEMKLYSRLDMTGSWTPDLDTEYHPLDPASLRLRGNIVDIKLQRVLSALEKHPYRIEYVNELRLEPSDGAPRSTRAKALFKLVNLVSGRIQRLDVLPFRALGDLSDADCAEFGCSRFDTALEISDCPFPRLTHLVVGHTGRQTSEPLAGWMDRMPNVRSLHFCSANGWYDGPAKSLSSVGPLQSLRTLTFDHLCDLEYHFADEFLAELLGVAPNLEILRLRGQWQPRTYDDSLMAIGQLKRLKRIVTLDADFHSEEVVKGIAYARFGKVDLAVEEGVVDFPGYLESEENAPDDIPIPRAPYLRTLTIHTDPRPPITEFAATPVDPDHPQTLSVPPCFVHRLRRAPLLTTLLYAYEPDVIPSAFASDSPGPDLFVPPSRWAEQGHRGIIVRQYRNEEPVEEEFWHVRILTRAARTSTGREYVGTRRAWWDLTNFKGRTVPRPILNEVYAEIGTSSGFVAGGRGLALGHGSRAWDILREWRAGAGDTQEEDEETFDDDIQQLDDE